MSALSNDLENKLINAALRNTAYTPGATIYMSLHTGDPGETGANSEVATGGYVRKAIAFGAPSDGVSLNTGLVTWTASGANYGTVSHVALWDALAGNCLFKGAMAASKTVNDGDTLEFAVGAVSASLA